MKHNTLPSPSAHKHVLIVDTLIFIFIVIIALIGVSLTDSQGIPSASYWKWIFMGMAVITTIWSFWRYRKLGVYEESKILYRQLILWSSGLISLGTLYLLLSTGRLNYETTGLLILLLLALLTFIEGMLVSWKLYLVGILLFIILLLTMYVESYLWIILLISVPLVLLVVTYVIIKIKRMKGKI